MKLFLTTVLHRRLCALPRRACLPYLLCFVIGLAATASLSATVLTNDISGPGFGPDSSIGAVYGNRVSSASSSSGALTLAYANFGEGYTPNIAANYGQPANYYDAGYGALVNVAYAPGGIFTLTFSADPGFNVSLYSFDLAGIDSSYQINSVSVFSGATTLFSQNNIVINGSANGTGVSSFSFGPLSAAQLTIQFDASNLGANGANIGIDNIRIGQVAVPEPSSIALVVAGAAVATFLARRRRS
jgi:hypothetical protein